MFVWGRGTGEKKKSEVADQGLQEPDREGGPIWSGQERATVLRMEESGGLACASCWGVRGNLVEKGVRRGSHTHEFNNCDVTCCELY